MKTPRSPNRISDCNRYEHDMRSIDKPLVRAARERVAQQPLLEQCFKSDNARKSGARDKQAWISQLHVDLSRAQALSIKRREILPLATCCPATEKYPAAAPGLRCCRRTSCKNSICLDSANRLGCASPAAIECVYIYTLIYLYDLHLIRGKQSLRTTIEERRNR